MADDEKDRRVHICVKVVRPSLPFDGGLDQDLPFAMSALWIIIS